MLSCSKCSKTYKTQRGLASHEATHSEGEIIASLFICSVCNRSYKTRRGLQVHSKVHSIPDQKDSSSDSGNNDGVNLNLNQDLDPALAETMACDVSDDDERENCIETNPDCSYFFEDDDEIEEYLRSLQIGEATVQQQQSSGAVSKKKGKLVKCNRCSKTYSSIDSYLKHKTTHAISDLYSHAPSEELLQNKSSDVARAVLEEMGVSKISVGHAATIKDTAKILLILIDSEEVVDIVQCVVNGVCDFFKTCDTFLTPSELRAEFLKSVASFIANRTERMKLMEALQGIVEISESPAHLFLASFVRKFADEMLAFYIHFMINAGEDSMSFIPLSERFVITTQPTETLDFKQLMHYVGGSNVKSLLRAALRIKDASNEWLTVIDIAKKYFLISELAAAPDYEIMAWTNTQDRGGLLKISDNLCKFFVELGATVKVLEHFDGSLYTDEVMDKVLGSPKLMSYWDVTLKGSVPQPQSLKLLNSLCSYFCSTWRKGIITRRLDQLSAINESVGTKHGMSGVAFRATIGK